MAIINYSDQMRFTGKGYLDSKMMPVKTTNDLKNVPLGQRFEGLTITVLNEGNPQDYWLVGGITNGYWVQKKSTYFDDLRIILEEGFLKLESGGEQLGEVIDFNEFFAANDNDTFIDTIDYTASNDKGERGVFLCFTYNNGAQKYLDMGQFLNTVYEPGAGIVIENNVISLDEAILGRITALETTVSENKTAIQDINTRLSTLGVSVNTNTSDIATLKERVDSLLDTTGKLVPDNLTIGINDDIYVKVLEKEGNMLMVDTNDAGESGLYAHIPVFYEDEELYKE